MTGARGIGRLSRRLGALVELAARLSARPGHIGALARELTAPAGAGARWLAPGSGHWSPHDRAVAGYDRVMAAARRVGHRRVLTVNALAIGPGPEISANLSGPPALCRQVRALAVGRPASAGRFQNPGRLLTPGRPAPIPTAVPIPTVVAVSGNTVCLVASVPGDARRPCRLEILGPAGAIRVVVPDRRRLNRGVPSAGSPPTVRITVDRRHRLVAEFIGPARTGPAR